MPDFTIQHFYHCESAEYFEQKVPGSNGKTYTVTYKYNHRSDNYEYDYHCTCNAFKFKKGLKNGYCKHINEVNHCNWTQFIDGDSPVDKDGQKHCPKCGAKALILPYGV
jgi:hypothetical protein